MYRPDASSWDDTLVWADADLWLPVPPDPIGRVVLPVQYLLSWGTTPAYVAATLAGHAIDNLDGETLLYVKNGGTADTTLILRSVPTWDTLPTEDHVVPVLAGGERLIAGIAPWLYNQPSGLHRDRVYVDYTVATDITLAVVHGGGGERTE